jgi:hypothetical protein
MCTDPDGLVSLVTFCIFVGEAGYALHCTEHFEDVRGCAVMYVVDFMLAGYYQKCHDPDCRGED